jgi:hypothetical protein
VGELDIRLREHVLERLDSAKVTKGLKRPLP